MATKIAYVLLFLCVLVQKLGRAFIPLSRLSRPMRISSRITSIPIKAATITIPEVPSKVKLSHEALELEQLLQEPAPRQLLIAQIAPSVRVAFSEFFGEKPGAFDSGILVASLKKLGFDIVLDVNTAADLTITEEGTELLNRILSRDTNDKTSESTSKPLPMFTSCCPGWMNMVQKTVPDLIPFISTCKSPHMMYGAVVKLKSDYFFGRSPEDIYMCSVMPCIKKRGESDHAVFSTSKVDGKIVRDVDNVITTKDLGALLEIHDIDPRQLKPMPFDSPFQNESGLGSGAGQLFGATGGVMEASVRSVYEIVTGSKFPRLEFDEVRGFDGLKEASVPLFNEETGKGLDITLRVAVVNGLGEAKKLIEKMKNGKLNYDFVEVMACPGGCIGGGGQPKSSKETLEKRMSTVYELDRSLPIRRSHENPTIKKLYEEILGKEYGSKEAKETLHVKQIYGE